MANTIIAKFQAEGLGQFTSEVNNASTQMEMFDKAQKIVNQTTSDLTKKQLELREAISSQGGIMIALKNKGLEQGKLYQDLKLKLDANIKSFEAETAAIKEGVSEKKKLILEKGNYKKILDQVANGEITAKEASKLLKQELVQLRLQGKQNTKEYLELKNVAGELADTIGDVSAEISQAGSDTRGLDKALRVATALTAGFGLVEGATALFGKENENLQKILVKVNGLMVVMNSLQEIQEELKKNDSVFTALQTKALALYNIVLGASSGALRIFRLALAGTGLLLIIPLIATLVANFDKLKTKLYEVFPSLKNIGTSFSEIKDNVIDFLKGALLGFLNGFSQAYNSSLLLRVAISALGATFKTVGGGIVLIAKNISTVFSTLWSAISDPKNAISILKTGFKDIITNFKDFGKNTADNFKQGFENAKKNRLELLDENDLFPKGKKTGEKAGENLAKDVKKGAEQQAKGDPIVLEFELKLNDIESETKQRLEDAIANFKNSFSEALKNNDLENPLLKAEVEQIKALEKELERLISVYNSYFEESKQAGKDFERELKAKIDDAKAKFKDAFNLALKSGENIQDNPALKAQIEQIKALEKELERLTSVYNSYFEESKQVETASNVPIIELSLERTRLFKSEYQQRLEDVKNFKEQGLISEKEYNDEVARLQQQRLAMIEANAQKAQTIYGEIFNVVSQGTQLAGQIIAQNAQKEISALDEKKNKGLISEKQYNKEVAKVKNEEAQKQRKVDIAMAAAKVPMVALEAFLGSIKYGLIAAGIITGLATAFATAQVVAIAKAPLPKFRHGGLVVGNKHEQGGVHAELEGNEFVLKREAVSKYGTKALDKINNGLLNPNVFNMPLLPVNMIYGNHTRNLDRSSEQIKNLQYKLSEKLEYIYQGIENGNQDRYMLAKKSNKILKQLKNSNKYG